MAAIYMAPNGFASGKESASAVISLNLADSSVAERGNFGKMPPMAFLIAILVCCSVFPWALFGATSVGGTLSADTVWTMEDSPITVTSSVTVAGGVTLKINPGVEVRLNAGRSLRTTNDARIEVLGTAEFPVRIRPAIGTEVWGRLAAFGTNAFLLVQHADISGGAVHVAAGASALLEDSFIHDFKNGPVPIAGCDRAHAVTVRRCHFSNYHETLWRYTPIVIEDSLFENATNPSSDALDFDGAPPGSVIRRCTFRNGPFSNTDAIDLGTQSRGVLVEDCLMYGFPNDKGISVGEQSIDTVIRNCLIYGCESGISVKDDSTAVVSHCTIVDNEFGIRSYNKADPDRIDGGGQISDSWNNVIWGNGTTLSLSNSATFVSSYSLLDGIHWPGEANIEGDPLFVNETARDYRLAESSPAREAGRDGAQLGARYPVGAPMAPSHPSFERISRLNGEIEFVFWADSNRAYSIQASESATATDWEDISSISPASRPRRITIKSTPDTGRRFFRIIVP